MLNNKTYDTLKYIALIFLPALATLILTLSGIWKFEYGEAVAATVTAVDVFLGALLKISSREYQLATQQDIIDEQVKAEEELEPEDHVPHEVE